MVHTVIFVRPYPAATPVIEGSPCCLAMLHRERLVPYGCTRERNHRGLHEATGLGGKKLAEWSDG